MTVSEQIVLEARNQTKDEFRELERDARRAAGATSKEFEKSDKAMKQSAVGLKDWKMGLLGIAGVATSVGLVVKQVWELGKAGTEIERTREKFDRLAVSVGTTGDALLTGMKRATQGLRSDAELVASATDLMALGLAKSKDEAVRLATVAGTLDMDMNQLVLTLTNMTTMRFDALGVSVDGFKEKVEELEAAGYSANDAFKEAFLRQAEAQIEKVGDVADTNAGKVMRMESALANLGDAAKLKAAPAVATLADEITRMLGPSADMIDFNEVQIKTVKGVRQAYVEYAGALVNVTEEYNAYLSLQAESSSKTPELMDAQKGYTQSVEETGDATEDAGQKANRAWGQFYALSGAIRAGAEASVEATPEIKNLLDGLDRDITSPIAEFKKDLEWFAAGGSNLTRKFEEIKTAVAEGALSPSDAQGFLDALFVGVVDLQEEIGHIDAEEAANTISEQFGVSAQEAAEWLMGTEGPYHALSAITSQPWYVDIYYREHNKPTGGGYGGAGGQESEPGPPAPVGGGGGDVEPGLVPGQGGQHGLHGIVPPGFPNDSFYLRASSGERVDITPQGSISNGNYGNRVVYRGGDMYVVNNYDRRSAALAMAQLRMRRRQALDASMG